MVRPRSRKDVRDGRYKGVRMRKWGKWVAEVRQPNSRDRIWLGSYDTAEEAARAYDAAVFCLRGQSAVLNFPEEPPEIVSANELSPSQIQVAASKHARRSPAGSLETALRQPPPENMFFHEPIELGNSSFSQFREGEEYLATEESSRAGGDDSAGGGASFIESRIWSF
ncbi:ethylene-responsive transcription factor ERF018-like [Andrographis paniculata]|uniref:ethylene-responsive transcription factor ERF018-like n=1 Tax=Andrographis paniculata TaxID=175694 RepID=UPI0021E7455C|nr:ethylene-responsive transcription factor ERF018-like [Andrographis paniculata]